MGSFVSAQSLLCKSNCKVIKIITTCKVAWWGHLKTPSHWNTYTHTQHNIIHLSSLGGTLGFDTSAVCVCFFFSLTWHSGMKRSQRISGVSQVALVVKNPPACVGDIRDMGLIPGSGRSPGGGNGNPLQYSYLENPMDREASRAYSPWGLKESGMTEVLSIHKGSVCVLEEIIFTMSWVWFPVGKWGLDPREGNCWERELGTDKQGRGGSTSEQGWFCLRKTGWQGLHLSFATKIGQAPTGSECLPDGAGGDGAECTAGKR